ncbi:hypothetical protein TcBrA4_0013170 [Trypanosoma cruzi]|nr:hypothetical protein TcBrA4_0013170 [Trypanosoma cruzi]
METDAWPTFQYPLPRWRLMNCDRRAQDLIDCDPESYRNTVFVFAIPGIVVAGGVAMTVLLYLICKYVFDCCGGRKQSPNFCCPLRGHSAKYSREDLLRPVLLAVMVFGLCAATCIWGCVSQHQLVSKVGEIHNISSFAIKNVEKMNLDFLERMTITLYDASKDVTYPMSLLRSKEDENLYKETAARTGDVSSMLNQTVIRLFDNIVQFSWGPYVLFGVSFGVSFIGMIFALCNCRRESIFVFLIMALLTVMTWGFNGLYSASSFLVSQSCFEMTEFTERRTNVVKAVTKCDDTRFGGQTAAFEENFRQLSRSICEEIKPYCYDKTITPDMNVAQKKVFACPTHMLCGYVTDDEVMSWVRTALHTAPQVTQSATASAEAQKKGYTCLPTPEGVCDLRSCSATCRKDGVLSDVGKTAKKALYAIFGLAEARSAFDSVDSQLKGCDAVFTGIIPLIEPFCQAAANNIYNLLQCTGLLGVTLIVALYTYGMGAKRFIPFGEALLPQKD